MTTRPTTLPFQLGEPVEHRGDRHHAALPRPRPGRRLHHARRGAAARPHDQRDLRRRLGARARGASTRSTRPCCCTTARSSSARSRTGSSTSPCSSAPARSCRSPSRASSRAAGIVSLGVLRLRPAHLARPPAPAQGGDARRPAARARASRRARCGTRSREKQPGCRVDSPTGREQRHVRGLRRPRSRELEDAFPLQPGQCGAVLAIGDDALPRHRLPPRRVRSSCGRSSGAATCSTRSSGSTRPPTHAARVAGFVDEVTDAPVTRGPSAGLGEDVRLRGPGVIGSGLELDGERIQLSAFTSDGGADRAFGRIARPSRRR